MGNRLYISVEESCAEPMWLNNVEPFLSKVMQKMGFDGEEVSVLFCTDSFIRKLNLKYRNIDSPTDVLSFEDGSTYIDEGITWKTAGDIVISVDMLPVNAEYFGVSLNEELKRLLIHGILHLNGYDHGDEHLVKGEAPECEMLAIQERLVKELSGEVILNQQ